MKTLKTQNDPNEDLTTRRRRLGRLTRILHEEFGFLTLNELRVIAKPFERAEMDFYDIVKVDRETCRFGCVNDFEDPIRTCVVPPAILRQLKRGDVFFMAIVPDGTYWRPIYVSPHLAARPAHDEWLEQFFSDVTEDVPVARAN